jgi:hypothetical protein
MPDMLDDPAAMDPSQRRREIAVILARGVLRAREFASTSTDHTTSPIGENAADSCRTCLDRAPGVALMDQPVNGTGERNETS